VSSYFVTVPERCVGKQAICVSFNLDDVIVEDRLVFNVISVSNVAHRDPKDFKNVTFNALSFFFVLMQLDERVLSSCDVTGLVKNALSLYVRSVQHEHLMLTLSLSPSYVQSNSDLFSSKIE